MTTLSFNEQESSSAPSDSGKDHSKFARYGVSIFAALYTFAFVGALFGWGPMQRMLEGSGAFDYMCSASTADDDACPAQSQILVNLGFLSTTLSIITPIIGHAVDDYGAPVVSYFMSFCAILGTALMVVAATFHISWLYWIVFGLLGVATFTGSLLSVQVGLYFVGHTQVRIIMLLNTLFDAGSVSYLFLWMIQEYLGVSFVAVAFIYFMVAVGLFVPASYFWTVAVPEEEEHFVPDESDPLHQADDSEVAHSETTASVPDSLRLFMESKMDYTLLSEAVNTRRGTLRETVRTTTHLPPAVVYGSIKEDDDGAEKAEDVLLAERSAKEQLLSLPYIMLVLFFSVSQISCNWSLITAADFLASLGDDGMYLKIFTLMQPASILALPFVDAIIRYHGFGAAFQGVNVINFVYIFIKVTSTNLHLQVVTFLLVAVVRCFLYATTFSFLPSLLSPDVVGRGTGFLSMVGGIASFLNIPLNGLASGGDFFIPNFIYLMAVIPCTFAARHVQRTISRETEIKNARQHGTAVSVSKL